MENHVNFNVLQGKTIIDIEGLQNDSELVRIECRDGSVYEMYHEQDCCENVRIYDIDGNVEDLLNSPITQADESTNNDDPMELGRKYDDSYTWTFYKLATIKGYVTIRWLGESNGYYSESVSFIQTEIGGDDEEEFEYGFENESNLFKPSKSSENHIFMRGDKIIFVDTDNDDVGIALHWARQCFKIGDITTVINGNEEIYQSIIVKNCRFHINPLQFIKHIEKEDEDQFEYGFENENYIKKYKEFIK